MKGKEGVPSREILLFLGEKDRFSMNITDHINNTVAH